MSSVSRYVLVDVIGIRRSERANFAEIEEFRLVSQLQMLHKSEIIRESDETSSTSEEHFLVAMRLEMIVECGVVEGDSTAVGTRERRFTVLLLKIKGKLAIFRIPVLTICLICFT